MARAQWTDATSRLSKGYSSFVPVDGWGFDMSVVLSGVFVAQIVGWVLLGLILLLAGVRRGGLSGRWPLHVLERNRLSTRQPDLTARPMPAPPVSLAARAPPTGSRVDGGLALQPIPVSTRVYRRHGLRPNDWS
jgi:hypothetical protein